MKCVFAALGMAALTVLFGAGSPLAHEGHDHDAAPLPASVSIAPRAEATSDAFELIAIAEGSELAIYLDRFANNEPVEGAAIEVETPNGSVAARIHGDAYRIPATWLSNPGRYDLIFTVTTKEGADVLPLTLEIPEARFESTPAGDTSARGERWSGQTLLILGLAAGFVAGMTAMIFFRRGRATATLVLFLVAAIVFGASAVAHEALAHEGEDHGPSSEGPRFASRDLAQLLPDGSVFVPKATQRILAIRTTLTEQGHFQRAIELPGRIIPDPNASGYVQASVGGRLSPPPGGFPKLGTRVSQGDVLAFVTPPHLTTPATRRCKIWRGRSVTRNAEIDPGDNDPPPPLRARRKRPRRRAAEQRNEFPTPHGPIPQIEDRTLTHLMTGTRPVHRNKFVH
jgi:membrane fusion protein, heavy metal efflux system